MSFQAVLNSLRNGVELVLLLTALAVGLQVLFGHAVPFLGGDVVGNITDIVSQLGDQGLVGLVAIAVLGYLFNSKRASFTPDTPPPAL